MCGIFALLNNCSTFPNDFIRDNFDKGRNRGPEFSCTQTLCTRITLGFHRLAINGLNKLSNQPIIIGNIWLICNGEIYNYKELYNIIGITPTTDSDCEVIIYLYKLYGIEQMLQMIDGVFAFVLIDMSSTNTNEYKLFIARDPFGVRPLYVMSPNNRSYREQLIGFASEMKMLTGFLKGVYIRGDYIRGDSSPDSSPTVKKWGNRLTIDTREEFVCDAFTIAPFEPGSFQEYRYCSYTNEWETPNVLTLHTCDSKGVMCSPRCIQCGPKSYFKLPFSSIKEDYGMDNIFKGIIYHFNAAIKKRYLNTERSIACLLSGGLDSSSVVASINELHKLASDVPLKTYSIGLLGSEDLRNARVVADYLGTNHTEFILKEEDFFNAIESTIYKIESFDTTTVRASIPNSILCDNISKMSNAKVIFNGDGADELFGGYLYEYEAPNSACFDADIRRLLTNIWKHDVRRSDGSISSHGLEARTPFLDKALVQFVMSISPEIRFHVNNKKCGKYLFREAFSKRYVLNSNGQQLLPDSILWRTKEAFSDGVSSAQGKPMFQILQEQISNHLKSDLERVQYTHLPPKTDEQYYYRTLFEKHFPHCGHVVPNFWAPNFVSSSDPSARTLAVYDKLNPDTTL
jgi:asparagine synthase (glutamine-hydrolysing)